MMTTSPGRSVGADTWSTQAVKAARFIGPSRTMGEVVADRRRAAVNVVVFQRPCGTGKPQRWPRFARPRRRAILVEAPVSSMETKRSGFSSGCAANQARRLAATSGRFSSLRRPVIFARLGVAVEETPDSAQGEVCAVVASEHFG